MCYKMVVWNAQASMEKMKTTEEKKISREFSGRQKEGSPTKTNNVAEEQ